jgi:hypothetical protein
VPAVVVDAIEAHLVPAILDAHARQWLPRVVANGHEEGVHAMRFATGLELGKDDHRPAVRRGVTNPFLARRGARRMEHEDPALGIVTGNGLEIANVRAVAELGHRKPAEELPASDGRDPARTVAGASEIGNGPAEEPELHAELHHQAEIVHAERLEDLDEAVFPMVGCVPLGEGELAEPLADEDAEPTAAAW